MQEQQEQVIKQEKTSENRVVRDEKGRIVSGTPNPNGRPKGSFNIADIVKRRLQELPPGENNKTNAGLLIDKMLEKAIIDGDHNTQKMIWNYMDGLPKGSVDLTTGGEQITGFNFISNDTSNNTDNQTGEGLEEVAG